MGAEGVRPVADDVEQSMAIMAALERESPMGHMVLDCEGNYLQVNDTILRMNGGTREDRVGRNIQEVQPVLAGPIMAAIGRVVDTGEPLLFRRVEGENRARPGDVRIWRVSYYPVRWPDGTVFAVGVIAEDVTKPDTALRHVDTLSKVTAALLRAVTTGAVRRAILDEVLPLFGAEQWRLYLPGPGRPPSQPGGDGSARDDGVADNSGHDSGGDPADSPPDGPSDDPPDGEVRVDGAADGEVVVPLVAHGGTLGALALRFPGRRSARPAESALLAAVADQCALALERAASLERAESAAASTRHLQRVTAALAAARSEDEVAGAALAEITSVLPATGGGIGLIDHGRQVHTYRWTFGWDDLEAAHLLGERPLSAPTLSAAALRLGRPVYLESVEDLTRYMPESRAAAVRAAEERESWIVLPLVGNESDIGSLGLSFGSFQSFTEEQRAFLESLAGQTALAFERVRRHQADHRTAVVLQRALLPDVDRLPQVPGLAVAFRYLAGTRGAQVGGDWYDLFRLEDGEVAMSVGDVAGHDIAAAGTMGRLRSKLRACAHSGVTPAETLDALDHLVHRADDEPRLATVVYALWRPGTRDVDMAVAGHPPALVVERDRTWFADGPSGPPLGTLHRPHHRDHRVCLGPEETTLVFYTDGLVERRGGNIQDGLDRLAAVAGEAPDLGADALADHLLAELAPAGGWRDDVALLVCRLAAAT